MSRLPRNVLARQARFLAARRPGRIRGNRDEFLGSVNLTGTGTATIRHVCASQYLSGQVHTVLSSTSSNYPAISPFSTPAFRPFSTTTSTQSFRRVPHSSPRLSSPRLSFPRLSFPRLSFPSSSPVRYAPGGWTQFGKRVGWSADEEEKIRHEHSRQGEEKEDVHKKIGEKYTPEPKEHQAWDPETNPLHPDHPDYEPNDPNRPVHESHPDFDEYAAKPRPIFMQDFEESWKSTEFGKLSGSESADQKADRLQREWAYERAKNLKMDATGWSEKTSHAFGKDDLHTILKKRNEGVIQAELEEARAQYQKAKEELARKREAVEEGRRYAEGVGSESGSSRAKSSSSSSSASSSDSAEGASAGAHTSSSSSSSSSSSTDSSFAAEEENLKNSFEFLKRKEYDARVAAAVHNATHAVFETPLHIREKFTRDLLKAKLKTYGGAALFPISAALFVWSNYSPLFAEVFEDVWIFFGCLWSVSMIYNWRRLEKLIRYRQVDTVSLRTLPLGESNVNLLNAPGQKSIPGWTKKKVENKLLGEHGGANAPEKDFGIDPKTGEKVGEVDPMTGELLHGVEMRNLETGEIIANEEKILEAGELKEFKEAQKLALKEAEEAEEERKAEMRKLRDEMTTIEAADSEAASAKGVIENVIPGGGLKETVGETFNLERVEEGENSEKVVAEEGEKSSAKPKESWWSSSSSSTEVSKPEQEIGVAAAVVGGAAAAVGGAAAAVGGAVAGAASGAVNAASGGPMRIAVAKATPQEVEAAAAEAEGNGSSTTSNADKKSALEELGLDEPMQQHWSKIKASDEDLPMSSRPVVATGFAESKASDSSTASVESKASESADKVSDGKETEPSNEIAPHIPEQHVEENTAVIRKQTPLSLHVWVPGTPLDNADDATEREGQIVKVPFSLDQIGSIEIRSASWATLVRVGQNYDHMIDAAATYHDKRRNVRKSHAPFSFSQQTRKLGLYFGQHGYLGKYGFFTNENVPIKEEIEEEDGTVKTDGTGKTDGSEELDEDGIPKFKNPSKTKHADGLKRDENGSIMYHHNELGDEDYKKLKVNWDNHNILGALDGMYKMRKEVETSIRKLQKEFAEGIRHEKRHERKLKPLQKKLKTLNLTILRTERMKKIIDSGGSIDFELRRKMMTHVWGGTGMGLMRMFGVKGGWRNSTRDSEEENRVKDAGDPDGAEYYWQYDAKRTGSLHKELDKYSATTVFDVAINEVKFLATYIPLKMGEYSRTLQKEYWWFKSMHNVYTKTWKPIWDDKIYPAYKYVWYDVVIPIFEIVSSTIQNIILTYVVRPYRRMRDRQRRAQRIIKNRVEQLVGRFWLQQQFVDRIQMVNACAGVDTTIDAGGNASGVGRLGVGNNSNSNFSNVGNSNTSTTSDSIVQTNANTNMQTVPTDGNNVMQTTSSPFMNSAERVISKVIPPRYNPLSYSSVTADKITNFLNYKRNAPSYLTGATDLRSMGLTQVEGNCDYGETLHTAVGGGNQSGQAGGGQQQQLLSGESKNSNPHNPLNLVQQGVGGVKAPSIPRDHIVETHDVTGMNLAMRNAPHNNNAAFSNDLSFAQKNPKKRPVAPLDLLQNITNTPNVMPLGIYMDRHNRIGTRELKNCGLYDYGNRIYNGSPIFQVNRAISDTTIYDTTNPQVSARLALANMPILQSLLDREESVQILQERFSDSWGRVVTGDSTTSVKGWNTYKSDYDYLKPIEYKEEYRRKFYVRLTDDTQIYRRWSPLFKLLGKTPSEEVTWFGNIMWWPALLLFLYSAPLFYLRGNVSYGQRNYGPAGNLHGTSLDPEIKRQKEVQTEEEAQNSGGTASAGTTMNGAMTPAADRENNRGGTFFEPRFQW